MSSLTQVVLTGLIVLVGMPTPTHAQHAVEIVSYDPGTTPSGTFVNAAAALGSPERFTGEGVFPGAVTPFNPPFLTSELVSVGEGGQLTLRISNFIIPQSGQLDLGVFTNAGLIDTDFPNGTAGDPVGTFGADDATVAVSEDGTTWESLGTVAFNIPTAGYTDIDNTVNSDFQKAFAGSLADFANLSLDDPNGPDILELFDGSGGGTWLDLSDTNLAQIGYVRFSVADDTDSGTELNFELDGLAISRGALGTPTVPEPSTFLLVAANFCSLLGVRVRIRML